MSVLKKFIFTIPKSLIMCNKLWFCVSCHLRGGFSCSSVFVRSLSSARASFCLVIIRSCRSPRHRRPWACKSLILKFYDKGRKLKISLNNTGDELYYIILLPHPHNNKISCMKCFFGRHVKIVLDFGEIQRSSSTKSESQSEILKWMKYLLRSNKDSLHVSNDEIAWHVKSTEICWHKQYKPWRWVNHCLRRQT